MRVFSAAMLAAASFLFGCKDSTAPSVEQVEVVDNVLAEVSSASTYAARSVSVSPTGALPATTLPSSAACQYNSSNQRFVCPATTSNGLTVNMYYQLLDASNNAQSAYDASTTAAIRVVTDVSGTVTQSGSSGATVNTQLTANSDQTVSGLLSGTHTLNGTSNLNANISAPPSTGFSSTLTMTMAQTITNLVLPKSGTSQQYPQSGTIASTITIGGAGIPATATTTVTLTFNGSSSVTMTIASGGFTQTCTLNLANPQSAPSCS